MWHETNLFGIYLPPLLVYMAVALGLYWPLHALAGRLSLFRWTWNAPLAGVAAYVCILGLLVLWL